jgi:N-dimethylarginine dimethylaminohydrolase
MSLSKINSKVLMSGAEYFSDEFAINAHMDSSVAVNTQTAINEHQSIETALKNIGVDVIKVKPPTDCQDGVYTANWGLCRDNKIVLSNLPNKRKLEEPYANKILSQLGFQTIACPFRFSGQGDALPCGDKLFIGTTFRTDPRAHEFVAQNLGYEVIGLQTVPKYNNNNQPVVNAVTGWPDSFFYDIDLALAVISPNLIAWCPEAFMPESQEKLNRLNVDKITVSLNEAVSGFACNLISTGQDVVMSDNAPKLKFDLEQKGLKTITPKINELAKGGGYIRCTSLTLS